MVNLSYRHEPWDSEDCVHENEIFCDRDINPLSDYLLSIQRVDPALHARFTKAPSSEKQLAIFKPTGPALAWLEYLAMHGIIGGIIEKVITEAQADVAVAALNQIRLSWRAKSSEPQGSPKA